MIKSKKERSGPIEIDLTGPDGNAFVLLAKAKGFAKQLNYTNEEIQELLLEMKGGDYEYLLQIFDDHFGKFVTLYR